jgi:hypothetical protein
VEFDHRAFNYDEALELAVLPLEDYRRRNQFHGVVALRVTPTGVAEIGRLAHGPRYRAAIHRSLIVQGRLYTISERGIAAHDPGTLQRLGWASFN